MTTQKEQALNKAYEKFMQLNLGDLPLELAPGLLAENMMIYGTARDERVFSLKEYVQILSNQREQSRSLAIQCTAKPVFSKISASEDVAIIVTENILQVLVEDNRHEIFVRRTTIMEYQNEQWLAVHVHTSKPDDVSSKEDTWHIQEWKRKNEQLQRLIDEKTADLEHKNRQLEIEAALERVRAEMMAMHKSEDLRQVIATVFKQLQTLGFDAPACALIIFNKDLAAEHWVTGFSHNIYPESYKVPYNEHPYFIDVLHTWQNDVPFQEFFLEGELKTAYAEWLFEHSDFRNLPEKFKNEVKLPQRTINTNAFMRYGMVQVISAESLPEEKVNIVKRFAKIFEQAYTRYLDLQKAEAQAREAQIEAALERVRARTMALHKSEELKEVIQLILDQLCGLHFNIDSASFVVDLLESHDQRVWVAAPGQQYASRINLPYIDHPIFNRVVEAQEKGEHFYALTCTTEEKDRFFDHFFKYAPVTEVRRKVMYSSTGWTQSSVLMKTVALNIQNYGGISYSEEQNNTLKRFGKVFEQTYTRFLDLQKAEASAKEAVRQASVDRVRAEIASMRTTSDLERITPLIWKELTILNVPFIRCGVFILSEEEQQANVYLSTPDGKAIAAFQLPFSNTEFVDGMLSHWRNNQIFVDHWDAPKFAAWTKSLVEEGVIRSDEKYSAEKPPENLYLHFVPFRQGMLYVGNTAPLTEDEISLVHSLADAFSTAYAKYDDFTKLESAKQQIEATLSELKTTQSQLIQKEKMASLGELTAGIAHEIQNPLNFVTNFSEVNQELLTDLQEEIAKGNLTDAKSIAEDLAANEQKINYHGKRADNIVKGMLQHSRSSSGTKEPTDINALADEYLRLSYYGLRAKDKNFNVKLITHFDTSLGKVEVVPQELGRVLLNLFNNAFYAIQEKKAQLNGQYQPEIKVTTNQLDSQVELRIRDNGIGIPENVKNKIFQPFFTTKPTGQGTGLGLSLSYDIITKGHGGELAVKTEPGEYTEFIINLPQTAKSILI